MVFASLILSEMSAFLPTTSASLFVSVFIFRRLVVVNSCRRSVSTIRSTVTFTRTCVLIIPKDIIKLIALYLRKKALNRIVSLLARPLLSKTMEHVERELSRITKLAERELGNVNWRHDCTSTGYSPCSDDVNWSFYHSLSNRLKNSDNSGDTALHWMLGTHAPVSVIENFLEMKRRHEHVFQGKSVAETFNERSTCEPSSIDLRTVRGATPLHVVVYRNSWYAESLVKLMLESKYSRGTSLASVPMSCGSYPLHVLCGHNITIQDVVLKQLLRASPFAVLKDDINGDNPFSLLWKNVLRFRWAISKEKGHEESMDYVDGGSSWMTIISPDQYVSYSLQMMKALRTVQGESESGESEGYSIHEICRIPRCPPLLLRLALTTSYKSSFGISGDAYSLDKNGMLPLHHAVQFPAANDTVRTPHALKGQLQSIVEILLQEYPEGVAVADVHGRIPLHYALENGCLEEPVLLAMIHLYPDSLRLQDPVSGLFPFALVARNRGDGPKGSFTSRNEPSSSKTAEWKQRIVPMSYLLLQICPEAIQYQYQASPSSLNQ